MISVIGTGPAGAYSASLLAKDYDVNLYEEHKEIGKPVQCTGIVSKNILNVLPNIKPFVQNKLKGAVFYSKHQKFELRTSRTQAYVICRIKLDNYLTNRAINNGAKLFKDRRFISYSKVREKAELKAMETKINKINNVNNNSFNKNPTNYFNKKKYNKLNLLFKDHLKNQYFHKTDLLIGADGPMSAVAKSANLYSNREFFVGVQAVIKGNFDKEMVELYFGDICPDFFAWVAPVSETEARVGLASHNLPVNPMFRRFMKVIDERRGEKHKILEMQGGLIPKYKRIKTQSENVFLVGDAALQNKQATGGGIIMSLIAANCLNKSIRTGKSYQNLWEKSIRKDLELSKMIRNKLSTMNNEKYDSVLNFLNKSPSRNVLEKYGDMDFPSKFALKMLFADLRLLKFIF